MCAYCSVKTALSITSVLVLFTPTDNYQVNLLEKCELVDMSVWDTFSASFQLVQEKLEQVLDDSTTSAGAQEDLQVYMYIHSTNTHLQCRKMNEYIMYGMASSMHLPL